MPSSFQLHIDLQTIRSSKSSQDFPPQITNIISIRLLEVFILTQLLQEVIDIISILIAAKQSCIGLDTVLVPLSKSIDHMLSQVTFSRACEGRDIVVPHVLYDRDDSLIWEVDFNKEVRKPGTGADSVLKLNGVAFEHRDEKLWGEGNFGIR